MTAQSDYHSGSWIPGPFLPWNETRTVAHVFLPHAPDEALPTALCGAGPGNPIERRTLVFGKPDYAPWKAECQACFARLRTLVRAAANTPRR